MASHEAYLRSALSKYSYPEPTKREVLTVLGNFTDLRPTIQKYVFNDGIGKDLLCLEGTIAVMYKGRSYNIPICMWLMDTHPYNPPLVYVKPTAAMQIKPGRHVDNTGRIYLPYLHEWKHPQSDIIGVIEVLKIVFGEEPPVFSKSASTPSQPSYPMHGAVNPPYPVAGNTTMPTYQPPSTTPAYIPPRPGAYPTPGPNQAYPPYPGYPPAPQASQPGYTGYPPPYPAYRGAQAAPGGYPPPVPPPASASQPLRSQPPSPVLSDEQMKLSLLSAVEDKMKRRLNEVIAQSQAEIDTLKKTQEDLNKGKQKLDDMLSRLDREQNDVERNIRLLQEKDDEIKEALAKMSNKEDVSIDDAVQPTAPLYKQLLNTFAEEQATEDAIYYMGEALRKGVIELDVFLKQVRELSRKQFMLRMLIHKCRQKAGLPDISS